MKKINSALISVYHKTGLDEIIRLLTEYGVKIYSTGGTQTYIEQKGGTVHSVEDLTTYPSILDGRVKTLHPKVFGGILARRSDDHLAQLDELAIPEIDLVIVDLYPFEETLNTTKDEKTIIEKIDIGGISLIRAAAKNYNDIVVVASQADYKSLFELLSSQGPYSNIDQRRDMAKNAFAISSNYDSAIFGYFADMTDGDDRLRISLDKSNPLRYGENPHQKAKFYGQFDDKFENLGGKALSYNNLVDVDAAIELMHEFKDDHACFAILKHTNPCGISVRPTILEAWKGALAGDPVSAFGGILISNTTIDLSTALEIDQIFYEVLIAPDYETDALALLKKKGKRILLKIKNFDVPRHRVKTLLNGFILQDGDLHSEIQEELVCKTKTQPTEDQLNNLLFANKCVKHLKSNTIVLARDNQLLGMGCGQTSRIDACKQAIDKALRMGFDLADSAMASDAFFPFPDCVEIAHHAGVTHIIQPGGSIKDQLSIDYCDDHDVAMVFTGKRHFKH